MPSFAWRTEHSKRRRANSDQPHKNDTSSEQQKAETIKNTSSADEIKVTEKKPSRRILINDEGIMGMHLPIVDSAYVSKYEIPANKIGTGKYGSVYRGELHRAEAAIKILNMQDLNEDALAEFKREVSLMAQFNSPHVVRIFGACITHPNYAIVMEYLPKGSLYKVLQKEKLTWEIKYKIALDIACGLFYLHEVKVIHGDVKSLNVLIDEYFRAKIADFGLSKLKISSSISTVGPANGGTSRWMAPELFETGAKSTKSSDVYSYGVVLWELGTHKIPLAEKAFNDIQIYKLVSTGEREEISKDTPLPIRKIIHKCWTLKAEDRPQMEEIVQELRNKQQSTFGQPMPGAISESIPTIILPDKPLPPIPNTEPKANRKSQLITSKERQQTSPELLNEVKNIRAAVNTDSLDSYVSIKAAASWEELRNVPPLAKKATANPKQPSFFQPPPTDAFAAMANAFDNRKHILADKQASTDNFTDSGNSSWNPNNFRKNESAKPQQNVNPAQLSMTVFGSYKSSPRKQLSSTEGKKQNQFIAAILKADLQEVKVLQKEGASLTEPSESKIYPLVAAAYSTNIEMLEYIEGELGQEADQYWSMVDLNEVEKRVRTNKPNKREEGSTLGWLGDWYARYMHCSWCTSYDLLCLKSYTSLRLADSQWYFRCQKLRDLSEKDKIHKDARAIIVGRGRYECDWEDKYTELYRDDPEAPYLETLFWPSADIHDKVVNKITESLNQFNDYVKGKTAAFNPLGVKHT